MKNLIIIALLALTAGSASAAFLNKVIIKKGMDSVIVYYMETSGTPGSYWVNKSTVHKIDRFELAALGIPQEEIPLFEEADEVIWSSSNDAGVGVITRQLKDTEAALEKERRDSFATKVAWAISSIILIGLLAVSTLFSAKKTTTA